VVDIPKNPTYATSPASQIDRYAGAGGSRHGPAFRNRSEARRFRAPPFDDVIAYPETIKKRNSTAITSARRSPDHPHWLVAIYYFSNNRTGLIDFLAKPPLARSRWRG